jgi:hypothetical protein
MIQPARQGVVLIVPLILNLGAPEKRVVSKRRERTSRTEGQAAKVPTLSAQVVQRKLFGGLCRRQPRSLFLVPSAQLRPNFPFSVLEASAGGLLWQSARCCGNRSELERACEASAYPRTVMSTRATMAQRLRLTSIENRRDLEDDHLSQTGAVSMPASGTDDRVCIRNSRHQ